MQKGRAMANFCGKCGSRLDAKTGLCPKCNRLKRPFGVVIMVILASLLVLGGVAAFLWRQMSKSSEPSTPPHAAATMPIIQNTAPSMTEATSASTAATEELYIAEPSHARETLPELSNSEEKPQNYADVSAQYMPILKNIQSTAIDPEDAAGQLCDLNGDGIPELAVIYSMPAQYPINKITTKRSLQCLVCDLYTIKEGRAFPLLEQEMLCPKADGCYGKFAFAEIDGELCFTIHGKVESKPLQKVGLGKVDQALDAYLEDVWKLGLSDQKNDQFHYDKGKIKIYTLEGCRLDCRTDTRYRYDSENQRRYNGITTAGKSLTADNYQLLSEFPWVDSRSGTGLDGLIHQLQEENQGQCPTSELNYVEHPVEKIYASSVYDQDYASHAPVNLLDSDEKTNWTEGTAGNGIGQYIQLEFWEDYQLDGIMIWAGNHHSENRYFDNARPKEITLTFSDGSTMDYMLHDKMECQILLFDSPLVTDSLRITIDSVYPGRKYEDTVISELVLMTYAPA